MKPPHIRNRKVSRTSIYTALYGHGGKFNNQPWSSDRVRSQDWNIEGMLVTIRANWRGAAFDPLRARILLSDINHELDRKGHTLVTEKDLQGGHQS